MLRLKITRKHDRSIAYYFPERLPDTSKKGTFREEDLYRVCDETRHRKSEWDVDEDILRITQATEIKKRGTIQEVWMLVRGSQNPLTKRILILRSYFPSPLFGSVISRASSLESVPLKETNIANLIDQRIHVIYTPNKEPERTIQDIAKNEPADTEEICTSLLDKVKGEEDLTDVIEEIPMEGWYISEQQYIALLRSARNEYGQKDVSDYSLDFIELEKAKYSDWQNIMWWQNAKRKYLNTPKAYHFLAIQNKSIIAEGESRLELDLRLGFLGRVDSYKRRKASGVVIVSPLLTKLIQYK